MRINYSEMAEVFKALGDENRIRILEMLRANEKCANEILEELNVTQPTLSHHMKVLCDSKLVEQRREGKKTLYKISGMQRDAVVEQIRDLMVTYQARRRDDDIVIL